MPDPVEGAVQTDANAAVAAAAAATTESQTTAATTTTSAEGSAFDVTTALAGLDADNREWLTKQGFVKDGKITAEDLTKLSKQTFNQDKLLGNAIRIPGKDATQEERDAFLTKLGRPATAADYKFELPKDLPEELPYDGEVAKAYASEAHKLGLTKEQAAGLHDWFAKQQVDTYKGYSGAQAAEKSSMAKAAVGELEKEWGPIGGETAKANLEFADRVLGEADPQTLLDLQKFGIIGPEKEIYSASLAKLFAKVGTALYKEAGVLKGNPSRIGNPFEGEGNLSDQMKVWKSDPDHARALMTAAGKKPADFGLGA